MKHSLAYHPPPLLTQQVDRRKRDGGKRFNGVGREKGRKRKKNFHLFLSLSLPNQRKGNIRQVFCVASPVKVERERKEIKKKKNPQKMTQQCLEPRNPMRHRHQTHKVSKISYISHKKKKWGYICFTDLNRKKKKEGRRKRNPGTHSNSIRNGERERKYPRMKKSLQSDCGSVAQK